MLSNANQNNIQIYPQSRQDGCNMARMRRPRLQVLAWLIAVSCRAACCAFIQVPSQHGVLAGDLEFYINRNSSLLDYYLTTELSLFNDSVVLCSVPLGYNDRSQIPCGCFSAPGDYVLTVRSENNSFVHEESQITKVRWPEFNIDVPEQVTVLLDTITVNSKPVTPLCKPIVPFPNAFWTLVVQDSQNSNGSALLALREVKEWWNPSPVQFPCSSFDRPGYYKLQLVARLAESSIIAESRLISATLSQKYGLQMQERSIFPCPGRALPIRVERPACATDAYRVRLFSVRVNSEQQNYIGEERVYDGQQVISFTCNTFDIYYAHYCFHLVSVSDSGWVQTHLERCIVAEARTNQGRGSWSKWGAWGPCTSSCGDSAVQYRTRLCNNPVPVDMRGRCTGNSVDSQLCTIEACPNDTVTSTVTAPYAPVFVIANSSCACGCDLVPPTAVAITHECSNNYSVWLIQAKPGWHVQVKFYLENFDHDYGHLQARDGREMWDRLIYDSSAGDNTVQVLTLWTDTSNVLIEFTAKDSSSNFDVWHGAILHFEPLSHEQYLVLSGTHRKKQTWPSWVFVLVFLLLSLIFCSTFILAWMLFARFTHHRIKLKYNILMSQSMQTSGGSSIGQYYDPLQIGNRLSSDSEPYDSSNLKYQQIDTEDSDAGSMKNEKLRKKRNSKKKMQEGRILDVVADVSKSPGKQGLAVAEVQASEQQRPLLDKALARKLHDIPEIPEDGTAKPEFSAFYDRREVAPSPTLLPKKRSIGIQLNSPALPPRRLLSLGSSMASMATGTPSRLSPTSSFGGIEPDFEYDYYEPNVPGSFLNWNDQYLSSDIFIDDIIADSDLMKTPVPDDDLKRPETSSISVQVVNTRVQDSFL